MKPVYSPPPIPDQALDWFRKKGLKPAFSYLEVWKEEHAIAFTAARVMERDILSDLRRSLTRAMSAGETFADWKKKAANILATSGWVSEHPDKPIPHRLKVIYDTNMRTARAAGQWARTQRRKDTHPYLMYVNGPSKEHRPEHVAWNGLILPVDDPFWAQHLPPNGWGCKCWVMALSEERAGRYGGPSKRPDEETYRWDNPLTGESEDIPFGIDPGFNYNFGDARKRTEAVEQ